MDLWQLKVFSKVLEENSFSKAGRSLNLSQPTVSSHIRDLETHFGCRLVDRRARGAFPTAAGELLYDYAVRMTSLREELESAMAAFQGATRGHLVVGGSTIPGGYILPRIIGAYKLECPEVVVTLRIGDSKEILDALLAGQLEIGIVGVCSHERNLVQEAVLEDEMQVVVPSAHPWSGGGAISLEILRREPFIAREPGSGTRKSFEETLAMTGHGLREFRVVAEMGSTHAVIQAIKAGMGVSILSTLAVAEDVASGRLACVAVEKMELRRSFYLTWRKRCCISPLGQRFVAFLRDDLGLTRANR